MLVVSLVLLAMLSFVKSFPRIPSSVKFASTTSLSMTPKHVLCCLADGSEEIEAVTVIDTLVRAGATVTTASVGSSTQVACSRGVQLVADKLIGDCLSSSFDLIVLPGGM